MRALLVTVIVLAGCSHDPAGPASPAIAPAPAPPSPVVVDAAVALAPPPPAPLPPEQPLDEHAVSAAYMYACARTRDAHVVCWGYAPTGTAHLAATPERVSGLADIAGITAVQYHLLAWTRGGEGFEWAGPEAPHRVPVADVVELAGSETATCARDRGGKVACWLEPDRFHKPATPVAPDVTTAIPDGALQIAVASREACARLASDVRCWTIGSKTAPIAIARAHGASSLVGLDRGRATFAAVVGGRVVAWSQPVGANLGAPAIPQLPADVTAVALGGSDICALGATVTCWDGLAKPLARRFDSVAGARAITVGDDVGCAAMPDRTVRCWGSDGHVGDGHPERVTTPVEVVGLTDATRVASVGDSMCARRASGGDVCWGWRVDEDQHARYLRTIDLQARVATPAATRDAFAPRAAGEPERWAGNWFKSMYSCERAPAKKGALGALTCNETWFDKGESGTNPTTLDTDLTGVVALLLPQQNSVEIACIARTGGKVECSMLAGSTWSPVPGATGATALAPGPPVTENEPGSACAVTASHGVECWDLVGDKPHEVPIPGITDAVELAGNAYVACARRATGRVVCWGNSDLAGGGTRATTETAITVPGVAL